MIAASLVVMVGRNSAAWAEGAETAASADRHRERLVALADEDVEVVAAVIAAVRDYRAGEGGTDLVAALLRSSEFFHLVGRANEFGFTVGPVTFDIHKIVERSRKIAGQLSNGVKFLMKKNKFSVIDGEAKLVSRTKVAVTGKGAGEYSAKNIVLATGARARSLPGLEADGKLVWSYKEAMVPPTMPKSLLVIGSAAGVALMGLEKVDFMW